MSEHWFNGIHLLILRVVREASRLHHAIVVSTDSATANCSSAQLADFAPKWTVFMGYPQMWR
eukprot:5212205-Lingulodinium_polyedra.AAC.1